MQDGADAAGAAGLWLYQCTTLLAGLCASAVLRYFIINGSAEVLVDDLNGDPVAQLNRGSFFGEMALLSSSI